MQKMQFFQFFLQYFVLVSILFLSIEADVRKIQREVIAQTIIVDHSGHGNFTTIQKAIDSIPSNNNAWICILVKAGIYNEKVTIPRDKPKILLQGESRQRTVIQFGDGGDAINSTTFSSLAEQFVATDITFKNYYSIQEGKPVTWAPAPAILVNGDKSAFYRCGFIGLQDTLTDSLGRHYFESCYIQGGMDFIWGYGRSIYQRCIINVTAPVQTQGVTAYITAQGRDDKSDNSGFVFKYCSIYGTLPTYLGRAYRQYSRVLFYKTTMSDIVVPEGWSAWNYVGKENFIDFAEVDCDGPGANKTGRVPWEKNLSPQELSFLTNVDSFINKGGWIQKQPKISP